MTDKKVIIYPDIPMWCVEAVLNRYKSIHDLQDKIGRASVAIISYRGFKQIHSSTNDETIDSIFYCSVYQTKTAYVIRGGKSE